MSEHIDGKSGTSLASLVSAKGGVRRDGPDAKTRLSVASATRRVSFVGFLNTFLGRDASPKGAKGPGSSAGSGLRPSEKESLKNSMNKTVEGDAAGEADGDVAAAAEEAALLIWNLLYGYGDGGALPGSVPDSLRQLASMLGNRTTLATAQPGLGLDAVQDAIHTANASAEMNSAAILARMDELLEGMPRHVLDEALGRMAGQMGLPATNGFEGVLAMLQGRITGVNAVSGKDLLGTLSASANPALPEESAGGGGGGEGLEELFQEFLSENIEGDAEFRTPGEIADEFAAWLEKTGRAGSIKDVSAEKNRLADAFATIAGVAGDRAPDGGGAKNQAFPEFLRALESALQSGRDGQREGAAQTLPAGSAGDSPAENAAVQAQPNAPLPGQTATVQNTHASSAGALLERMENIERLAEAMRSATKGGVSNITMQLAPAELGRVMLRVQSKNGVVSASIRAERAEAAEQLSGNLHQLKESLKALGIELGAVEIRHQPPSGGADLLADLEHGEQGGGGYGRDAERRDPPESAPAEAPSPADGGGGTGALNFIA